LIASLNWSRPVPEAAGRLALIVEDNPDNMLLMKAVLRRAGYRTEGARTAAEAEARLQVSLPDVILMDIQLPGEDGLTLTRRLRADARTAAVPVIALTAHAMADDQVRAQEAGCDGYITKPIDTGNFAGQLAAILDGLRPKAGAP
jgi:CheY-like chemotaxis protein